MELTVEKLQSIDLKKGQILIVTFDETMTSDEDMIGMHEACSQVFTENKCIFVPKHIEISVINEEHDPDYIDPDNYDSPIAKSYVKALNNTRTFKP